jgi:hypothetical protein
MIHFKMKTRAISYLHKVHAGRNIRSNSTGDFEIESGADHNGNTFWSRIAYIAQASSETSGQTLLIDVTGDTDSVMLIM